MPDLAWQTPLDGLRVLRRGRVPIRRIQVYGQRCSGTHAIIKLIEANFGPAAFTEAFGFKHWFVPPQTLFPPDTLVLVIARAPHDWLRSLHRQPWHAHPTIKTLPFDAFIRAPWHSYWDADFWGVDADHPVRGTEMLHERDPDTGARFANPVAKRTAKLRHWAGLHHRAHNLALLALDAVRRDPRAVVESLAGITGLPMPGGFVPITTYKGDGATPVPVRTAEPLSPDDARFVAEWLDPTVERLFGFDPDASYQATAGSAATTGLASR